MRPEFKGNLTQAAIHQLYEKQEARGKKKKQQKERGGSYNQKSTKGEACFNCGAKPVHPRSQWPATQSVFKSVEKRDIMALDLFASPKEEGISTSYKPSLSMRPQTKTAQRKTIRKCILLQPCII